MIGKLISHYKIIEEIGAGGMGVVYKARDTKLDRTVALKFLPSQLSFNQEEKKRFIHEAKAAAALSHTNIVTIYEINKFEDQTFIAMEYLQGETLKDKINSGPLPKNEAIDITVQIAKGLQEAHEKNIVHRDIKPANIFITQKNEVKILDFGLAKLRGVTKLTKDGTTLGTVAYMSPEQTSGDKVDHRSDIWSLGVVLYEMITGQLPFKGEYEQAVMYSIMNEEPEPVTSIRSGVPLELERILSKALRKDTSERYQYIEEIMVDLKQINKQFSREIKKPGKPVKKKEKPFSTKVIFTLTIAALLIIFLGGYFLFIYQPKQIVKRKPEMGVTSKWKNSIAVLPFTNISADKEQEYFCDGMTEEIITKLTTIKTLKVISRTSVMKFKKTNKTIREIGKELVVKNVLEGSVRRSKNRVRITAQLIRVIDDAHLWAKNYDRKLESIFEVQDEVSKSIAESLKVSLTPEALLSIQSGQTKNIQAYEYYLKGLHIFHSRFFISWNEKDFDAARKMLIKSLEIDPEFAMAYNRLVYFHAMHYIFSGKTADIKMMKTYADQAVKFDPHSAMGYSGAAMWFAFRLKQDNAFPLFKKAININPNDPIINYAIVGFYITLKLYNKAFEFCTLAMEADPLFFPSYLTAARCQYYLGDYEKCEYYLKQGNEILQDQPLLINLYARFYLRQKKFVQAEKWIKKLETLRPDSSSVKRSKALLYALQGNKEKALAIEYKSDEIYSILGMKEQAINMLQKYLNKNPLNYAYIYLLNCPFYDNLRNDPRFQKIMEKAKMLHEERLKKYGDL